MFTVLLYFITLLMFTVELLVETARCVGVDHLKSWSDAHQTLVYCLGSLKFLSSNTSLLKLLAT